jgi:hypothetical protein
VRSEFSHVFNVQKLYGHNLHNKSEQCLWSTNGVIAGLRRAKPSQQVRVLPLQLLSALLCLRNQPPVRRVMLPGQHVVLVQFHDVALAIARGAKVHRCYRELENTSKPLSANVMRHRGNINSTHTTRSTQGSTAPRSLASPPASRRRGNPSRRAAACPAPSGGGPPSPRHH